jgi:hypothetical protein
MTPDSSKKGVRSAGVQRQYTATSGKKDNCQVGVFAAYVTPHGHALIDRELYLPESWTADRARCRAAGIPDTVAMATKPRIAIAMLQRVLDAGVPFAWLAADEVYGQVKYLRVWLEAHDICHVLATRCNDDVLACGYGLGRVDEVVAALPARSWRPISCGEGAHGPRVYDWARVPIRIGWRPGAGTLAAGPPLDQRPHRDRLLHLLRPTPQRLGRSGPRRRRALAGGGMFPAGQERNRPG